MKFDVELVKQLRLETGAGYLLCKKVLLESKHLEEARLKLRQEGFQMSKDKMLEQTEHGVIHTYVHTGNRLAAMVEVKCTSDFVAKTKEVNDFAQDIAMQVAAMRPKYVSRDDIPKELIGMERWMRKEKFEKKGYEPDDKILREEINRWCAEICLLEQPYIKENAKQVKDVLAELVLKVKENCKISRFQLWEVGT